MNLSYSTDIVIFGGGIAGLWMLKRLHLAGYQAILLEKDQLGAGQTLASQGIVHGGLKYALSGNLGKAANTISDMPSRWRNCLAGNDVLDLSGVRVLQEHYYMWSASTYLSKLKTFLGSKSLQGRVENVDKDDYPEAFSDSAAAGSLYRLPDFVIDSRSLIEELSRGLEPQIFRITSEQVQFLKNESGNYNGIEIATSDTQIKIDSSRIVFSAGEGNAELIEKCALQEVATQTRPLHMVYLSDPGLPPMFVHCIGDDFSMTPMLTVTSHSDESGNCVWYLGGELAESGVGKSKDAQIKEAKVQLKHYFPWIDMSNANWDSFEINRAEAKMADGSRPDDAVMTQQSNIIVAFPTKFTLTPSLADRLLEQLEQDAVSKSRASDSADLSAHLPLATVGQTRWDKVSTNE